MSNHCTACGREAPANEQHCVSCSNKINAYTEQLLKGRKKTFQLACVTCGEAYISFTEKDENGLCCRCNLNEVTQEFEQVLQCYNLA